MIHGWSDEWRCRVYGTRGKDVEEWFRSQGVRKGWDYEAIMRFNSGDPALFVSIYTEELATAFALRWVHG